MRSLMHSQCYRRLKLLTLHQVFFYVYADLDWNIYIHHKTFFKIRQLFAIPH